MCPPLFVTLKRRQKDTGRMEWPPPQKMYIYIYMKEHPCAGPKRAQVFFLHYLLLAPHLQYGVQRVFFEVKGTLFGVVQQGNWEGHHLI